MATQLTAKPPATTVAPQRKRGRRPRWLIVLAVAVAGLLSYLLSAYVPPNIATSRIPVRGEGEYLLLLAHISFATIATVTGLLQLWPWLRGKHPVAHRWIGRAYFFLGVFPAAAFAVPVVLLTSYGVSNQAGVLAMDTMWVITGIAGYRSARQRRFGDHRKWMIRNYAVTLASLATRPWQVLFTIIIVAQANSSVYDNQSQAIIHDLASTSTWLGLFVNLVVVECYLQRRPKHRRSPSARRDLDREALPAGQQ